MHCSVAVFMCTKDTQSIGELIQVWLLRYAEELRLREFEARMEGELGSPSCTTLDATAVRGRR